MKKGSSLYESADIHAGNSRPGTLSSTHYHIFSTPYLLASKIEAFTGRGGGNFYFSSDIEDIVALLDGRLSLFEEVQQADYEVKAFLSGWFRAELENLCSIAPAFKRVRC